MRRLRFAVRSATSKQAPDGTTLTVQAYGLRVGYWPCLQAPFIELAFHKKRYEVWYGLRSYQVG